MGLTEIAILLIAAFAYILIVPGRWRGWVLLVGSIVGMYWLFPAQNIRWLEYGLVTATLVITIVSWFITRPTTKRGRKFSNEDRFVLVMMALIALGFTFARETDLLDGLISRPPPLPSVAMTLLVVGLGVVLMLRLPPRLQMTFGLLAIIGLFVVIRLPFLTTAAAAFLRQNAGQDASLASPIDIGWLGFSYVAFRLIHTIRDRQMGLLPALSLREYLTYVLFLPAYVSGPIDRAERFLEDERALADVYLQDPHRITVGLSRIGVGLFKKFIIADSLAIISLSGPLAEQATGAGALWLMLYAYAFRLFLDFSGYTDIAIGLGVLFGIELPENFSRPYLKQSIAAFWQSWHMTLSNWAKSYVYSPLSRSLIKQKRFSNDVIVLLANLATMAVIGLWHGMTLPFLVWGLWHGLGLTVHKLWSDRTRRWYRGLKDTPNKQLAWQIAGVLLTFHFVLLGWVWFALPDVQTALDTFVRLLGGGA